jgi:hypothetical protein
VQQAFAQLALACDWFAAACVVVSSTIGAELLAMPKNDPVDIPA